MRIGLVLLTFAAPAAVLARPTATVAPIITARAQSPAQALAALVLPIDRLLTARLPRFDALYAEELKEDRAIAALEETRPGITSAIAAAGREDARAGYTQAVMQLRAETATLYAARLTPADLAALTRFIASRTGQALLGASAESVGESAAAFEADRRQRIVAMLSDVSPVEQRDLIGLQQSGVLGKLSALGAEVSALSARRFSDVDTVIRARLPDSRAKVIASYIGAAK